MENGEIKKRKIRPGSLEDIVEYKSKLELQAYKFTLFAIILGFVLGFLLFSIGKK
ncbi:hypothetical protein [Calditerrivibrio nitroreducens]|uniref:Uncharacterized protein n=1 Tax=Calditerrivibrio nitroreducens (strain DSM 19672 / NBRC 101217 / Yu37-1) TaxID=768670 RepID=E4TKC2_CALNY|nr:hypothetical protein [Calditerrivibrio nitroreducens]ADR19994.1 hypothetical protein Calni_2104 [Calditerrivibrio nitroreducens DSM 19672]